MAVSKVYVLVVISLALALSGLSTFDQHQKLRTSERDSVSVQSLILLISVELIAIGFTLLSIAAG
jgi:hypothetical protein